MKIVNAYMYMSVYEFVRVCKKFESIRVREGPEKPDRTREAQAGKKKQKIGKMFWKISRSRDPGPSGLDPGPGFSQDYTEKGEVPSHRDPGTLVEVEFPG